LIQHNLFYIKDKLSK